LKEREGGGGGGASIKVMGCNGVNLRIEGREKRKRENLALHRLYINDNRVEFSVQCLFSSCSSLPLLSAGTNGIVNVCDSQGIFGSIESTSRFRVEEVFSGSDLEGENKIRKRKSA
jgi:hypothetical protein